MSPDECDGRLFVDSGLDGATLCTAIEDPDGTRIIQPVVDALIAELTSRKIDVLVIDPFVSSHSVSDNDNGAMDMVAKEWARIAKAANCSIVLVHHTRKLGGMKVTAEMSRGAVAVIAAARSTLVLNRMDTDEAKRFAIEGDEERRRLFSVQDDNTLEAGLNRPGENEELRERLERARARIAALYTPAEQAEHDAELARIKERTRRVREDCRRMGRRPTLAMLLGAVRAEG